jgi:hypothetical protein
MRDGCSSILMPTGARLAPRPYLGTEKRTNNPLGPSEANDSHTLASSRSNSCGGESQIWGAGVVMMVITKVVKDCSVSNKTFEVHDKLGSSGDDDRI